MKWVKRGIVILAIFVCGIFLIRACNHREESVKFIWSDMVLGEWLPIPPKDRGEVHENSLEELWVDIHDISQKQYADYMQACKECGFIVDAVLYNASYEAYNQEGYKVSLNLGYGEELKIRLNTPIEMQPIEWPSGTAGKLLPKPSSEIGKFSYEYDDHFSVYVGATTKEDYNTYVKLCSEQGFNIDYSKGDRYYDAQNKDGWSLSLEYEGNNIMHIWIDAPKEETPTPAPSITHAQTATPKKTPAATAKPNGMDPDFKAAMDHYEQFVDEYVSFMKKYEQNPEDMSLLVEYADLMREYATLTEAFEQWEEKDLTATEAAYYIEVIARVSEKMLEVN